MKFFANENAVSQVVGHLFSILLSGIVVTSTIFVTNAIIEDKTTQAAGIQAQDIANYVADTILTVAYVKEEYTNADYSNSLDLPQNVAGLNYYIESDSENIYVNSTNGRVSKKSSLYNLKEIIDIPKEIVTPSGKINISCEKSEYLYKFDFGNETTPVETGYTKVTDFCLNPQNEEFPWWDDTYTYRNSVTLYNPTDQALVNYPFLVHLDKTTFDYSKANSDGSDIRFVDKSGTMEYDYWIEAWNIRSTGSSRIWVKLNSIPIGDNDPDDGKETFWVEPIFMYYGNPNALPKSNGEKTFSFFSDFSEPLDGKWEKSDPSIEIKNNILTLNAGQYLISSSEEDQTNVIFEAKAKAVGSTYREANMFVRCANNPGISGYIMSSGAFGQVLRNRNLCILKNNNILANTTLAMDTDWNIYSLIIDENTIVIARRDFDLYSFDGNNNAYTLTVEKTITENGHFGLYNTGTAEGSKSKFDWILYRQYIAQSDGDQPYAELGGTHSMFYWWDSSENIFSANPGYGRLGGDFVYSLSDPGTFKVNISKELFTEEENAKISINFLVSSEAITKMTNDPGDISHATIEKYYLNNNIIKISVDDQQIESIQNINPDEKGFFSQWVTIDLAEQGDISQGYNPHDNFYNLEITIDDVDNSAEQITDGGYYWNICSITIEKGEKKIGIKEG